MIGIAALFLFLIIIIIIALLWFGKSQQGEKNLQSRLNNIAYTNNSHKTIDKAPLFREQLEQNILVYLKKKQQRIIALGGKSLLKLIILTSVVGASLVALLLSQWTQGLVLTVIFLSILILIPILFYLYLEQKNRKEFESLLPQAVELVARASLAGSSVPMAIQQVAEQVENPVGEEFAYIRDQLSIGTELDEAFGQSVMRMPLPAYQFFVVTLLLNQDSGGRLAEVMQTLTQTLRTQRKMLQKIQTLTAEPRNAANIVALIPVFVFIFMYFLNPDNALFLIYDSDGQEILSYVIGSILVGLLIIKALTRVKV